MAYDPTLPANGSPLSAAEMRAQLAGLNDLITDSPSFPDVDLAIHAGAAGPVLTVNNLSLTVANPPTQAQMQAVVDKLNELITKLKRL